MLLIDMLILLRVTESTTAVCNLLNLSVFTGARTDHPLIAVN
jgi:hypothetical protein